MTKHNNTCEMSFGRPSAHNGCPRCNELKQGAPARKWNVQPKQYNGNGLNAYCFSVSIHYPRCTALTNPRCACGKMSYTD